MTPDNQLEQSIVEIARRARSAAQKLAKASSAQKDEGLRVIAANLRGRTSPLLQSNRKDVERAKQAGLTSALIDRLTLTKKRIEAMAAGLDEITRLPDPVGEVTRMWRRPNGLRIGKVRVPIGVIGFIYESRPNVTVDAAGLCVKSGNAIILRGGSEAIESNSAVAEVVALSLGQAGLPEDCVQLLRMTDRAAVNIMLKLDEYIDLIIPRGGKPLIKLVVENSMIPVIMHYEGICHTYVDEFADLDMAETICMNAKVQRPGVCNAMETLLVHSRVAEEFLPRMCKSYTDASVEIRGCDKTRKILPKAKAATDEDWRTEYLDLILSVKVVDSIDEAIEHIARYGSAHSDAIVTENYRRAQQFIEEVDSSAVFVNASTRFNDGFEFGLGAEIGISTNRLHCRGPMGLEELTTYKYIVYGNGQIRQ
ncbi:MAG: glutamate-5-semialdehyde dehydrogenase [Candidatus Abyssobacteria bacterium SURF_17]|uniref:Gamma-glutamyl phosphate reductase n=1 Tax=Candidatus Abyssobacteria bacterium SURF_17 TaxID=2093361 RepID=A0A419EYN8_9BACT|nr:MAG: glutamate-5-semialdehyde dehydrogenase [Candidatus Abyssubacteria bacterium SURF_17]